METRAYRFYTHYYGPLYQVLKQARLLNLILPDCTSPDKNLRFSTIYASKPHATGNARTRIEIVQQSEKSDRWIFCIDNLYLESLNGQTH